MLLLSTMPKDIAVADHAKKRRKQFPPTMKQSTKSIYLTKWLRNTLAKPTHDAGQGIVSKTNWISRLLKPGFSTKRLPLRIFIAKTLSVRRRRSLLNCKCRSAMAFQAKHHLPSATKTKDSQINYVKRSFCARETALLACALNV